MNGKIYLNVFCVIPKNSTSYPKNLALAQKCCKEHGFNVHWITEEDCMKLEPCRKDLFILTAFDGLVFEFLKSCNSKVVGPQYMLAIINNEEPLPDVSISVFSLAMKRIVITSTGLSSQEKKSIQEKIQFLGGNYSPELSVNITHLIVKSVADFSPKFKVAVGKRIPRMIPEWIDAVWDANLEEIIHATDPIFACCICPIFHGCVVSTSQVSIKERDSIKKIVQANGGEYSAKLERGKTNILIITLAEGEKYSHARRWKIRCLKPEWIQASLEKGYAVDPKCFTLNETTTLPSNCSTPRAHSHSFVNVGDSSVNTTIFDENQQTCRPINETAFEYPCSFSEPQRYGSLQKKTLDCLDLTQSVNAGPFLKDYKVFLSGFSGFQLEKLRRILKNTGLARSFVINTSISHVIVGETVKVDWDQLMKLENKPHVVTVEWLAQSLRLKSAATEADYLHPEFKNLCNFSDTKGASNDDPPIENIDGSLDEMQFTLQPLIKEQIEEEESAKLLPILSDLTLTSDNLKTYSVNSMNGVIASNNRAQVVTKNSRCLATESIINESANCDTPSYLRPSTNGTNTLHVTPEPRPALCNMLTPDTPYGRLLNPDPSPGTRKMWKHALDNRVRLTPRVDESVDTTASPYELHPTEIFPGINEYFHNLTKRILRDSLSAGNAADNKEATASVVPRQPPFQDVVIFFEDIELAGAEMMKIVESLDGRVSSDHCKEVTHFVFQGESISAEAIQNVKKWQQKLVSIHWILDCEAADVLLEESDYLPSSLNHITSCSIDCDWLSPVCEIHETNGESHTHFSLTEVEKERHQESFTDNDNLSLLDECLDKIPSTSYNYVTKYDDMIAPGCLDMSQPTFKVTTTVELKQKRTELSKTQETIASQSVAPAYCIMFSGMSQEDRDSCTEILEILGGTVVRANQCDPACTHLVVAKLRCKVKLLTSIAAGKWIVHPGWVYQSEKMGRLVDERKYEWGNPTCNDSISTQETKIAAAAYYWRVNRDRDFPAGPFQGITAALHLGDENDSFQRLLEAGGGEVVPQRSALEDSKTNLCILENREIKTIPLSLYASKGIYCVPPVYLRSLVLAVGKKLQWSESVLPVFRPYLSSMPFSSS
ncbi:DNA topoisomerase 2-binding protein 1-A-like [Daphnia carinata]|uniref:DNA topoisomerase 2-binding protein 1-A-like n=1 Tax=Daphnia carinata TaxID=120202 RepID=UPI00257D59CD|nr:DNA topoisomerase 2-binding protein 1-A-like [Daphnia carinata]